MLGLPKKTLVAIEAVLDIAYHAGGAPVQSTGITERQGIPRRSLEPVLQQLTRAGVLAGVRGPRGGYRLARERRRISVGDIVRVVESDGEVIEGDVALGDGAGSESGSDLGMKVVRPLWRDLGAEVMARLDEISVDDLCVRARAAGVASQAAETVDFTI
jgi:Rrf2 family transcriptional regulator, iron-sulfur cluster assembly transcription factor